MTEDLDTITTELVSAVVGADNDEDQSEQNLNVISDIFEYVARTCNVENVSIDCFIQHCHKVIVHT